MHWVLVYIVISGHSIYAVNAMGPKIYFETITDCFFARERLSLTVGGTQEGYFPLNTQGICMQASVVE